jgi:phosphatidylglycerophosphatase A
MAKWRFRDWWSVGLGLGLLPVMPGTMGTFLGVPLAIIVHSVGMLAGGCLAVLITVYSWWACCATYKEHGQRDHAAIVSDEVVGVLWVLYFVPLTGMNVVLGFILFRLFDIAKPWPVSMIDQRSGPDQWGAHSVMLDDLMAALFAIVFLKMIQGYGL